MITWNHRIVSEDGVYRVCEVFYDMEGNPWAYGHSHPIVTYDSGDDPARGLAIQLRHMLDATRKPILRQPEDFVGGSEDFFHNAKEVKDEDLFE